MGESRSLLPGNQLKSVFIGKESEKSGILNVDKTINFDRRSTNNQNLEAKSLLKLDRGSKIVRRNIAKGRNIEKDEAKLQQMFGQEMIWEQAITSDDYLNHTIGPNKTFKVNQSDDPKHKVLKKQLLFEFLGCAYR